MKEKLWSVISEDKPAEPAPDANADAKNVANAVIPYWKSREDHARGWIGLRLFVNDNQLCHIRNSNTAKKCGKLSRVTFLIANLKLDDRIEEKST